MQGKKRLIVLWIFLIALFLFIGCSRKVKEEAGVAEEQPKEEPALNILEEAQKYSLPIKDLCSMEFYFRDCMRYGVKNGFKEIDCRILDGSVDNLNYSDICIFLESFQDDKFKCFEIENLNLVRTCFSLHNNYCIHEPSDQDSIIFGYYTDLISNLDDYSENCKLVNLTITEEDGKKGFIARERIENE